MRRRPWRAVSAARPMAPPVPGPRAWLPMLVLLLTLLGLLLALVPRLDWWASPAASGLSVSAPLRESAFVEAAARSRPVYTPERLLGLFRQGTDSSMAWQRWVASVEIPASLIPGSLAPRGRGFDNGLGYLLDSAERPLSRLLGLTVRTVVIDPGHGGRDSGAIGPGGLMEKDVNLALALSLRERLARQPELYILLTREQDNAVSLRDRVAFANLHGADLFISIHVNALAQESRPFVETFYLGSGEETVPREQLALENRNSGYTVGEFRQLLDRLDSRFRNHESRRLAAAIQNTLYPNLRRHNSELLSGGLKTAPLVVLLGARMPAVLVEVTSLSNREEEARLRTPAYRELIAAYLERGILEYLSGVRFDREGEQQYARQENDPAK